MESDFNKKELELLMKFLDELDDVFSCAGCNDWDFPADWTNEEKIKFVKEFHNYNGDPEEFDEEFLHMADFSVLGLLKKKLENHFENYYKTLENTA